MEDVCIYTLLRKMCKGGFIASAEYSETPKNQKREK